MKKLSHSLILSLTILLSLTTVACNQETKTESTTTNVSDPHQAVGVIDTVSLLRESTPGKAAISYLENLQDNAIARLKPLEEKLNNARENQNEEEFKEIAMQMQSISTEFQEALKIQQEVIFGVITQELTTIIDSYRSEKNITVIFNTSDLISYDKNADISQDIMLEFNKVAIDYQEIIEQAFGQTPNDLPTQTSTENTPF